MAKIEIFIDTEKRQDSFIKVNDEVLDDVTYISIWSMDKPEYLSLEVTQYENGEKEGELNKRIVLTGSAKAGLKLERKESGPTISDEDLKSLAEILLRREI